jgi:predicted TIM-barrel fold metal-dependent hydrolase
MIIDVHTHIFESLDVFQKSFLDNFRAHKRIQLGDEGYKNWEAAFDGRIETLIKDMDEAGVDKSIVLPAYPSLAYGDDPPKISIWRCNEYGAEAQRKFPDRIISFVRIDPLRRDAMELLVRALTEWGLRGVKIHPSIPLDNIAFQPLLNKINELEVPVLIHMGVDPVPFLAKHGNPLFLDELASRFPKMKIVAAHHARGFEDLLTAVMLNRGERIYSDLAFWQHEYVFSHWRFIMKMRYFMDRIPRLVLMGSDWPFTKTAPPLSHKEWFEAIKNLKIPAQVLQLGLGIKDFSDEEKKMILGENARTLLNL